MLDKFHMCKLDEADLTPEQWRTVFEFIMHNFGNLANDAVLALYNARDGLLTKERAASIAEGVTRRYYDIIDTVRAMEPGTGESPGTGGNTQIAQISAEETEENASL